jgi:hypothetical protein
MNRSTSRGLACLEPYVGGDEDEDELPMAVGVPIHHRGDTKKKVPRHVVATDWKNSELERQYDLTPVGGAFRMPSQASAYCIDPWEENEPRAKGKEEKRYALEDDED